MKVRSLPVSPLSLQVLADPRGRHFLMGYALDRVASWILTIAVIVLAYRLTESVAAVAGLVLVQLLSKVLVGAAFDSTVGPAVRTVIPCALVRILAAVGLVVIADRADLGWVYLAVAVVAGMNGVIEGAYANALPGIGTRRHVPVLNRLVGRLEQISALVGPVIAGLILFVAHERVALGAAAVLFMATPAFFWRATLLGSEAPGEPVFEPFVANWESSWARLRSSGAIRMVLMGLLVVAAMGVLIRVALVDAVVDDMGISSGYYGLLLGLIGIGALIGPVPVDKLLGHLNVEIIMTGGCIALCTGAAIVGIGAPALLMLPVLLVGGLLIVTLDLVAAVTLRRVVSDADLEGANNATIRAVLTGQVLGLVLLLLGSYFWTHAGTIVAMCAAGVVFAVVLFITSGGRRAIMEVVPGSRKKVAPRRGYSG